MKVTRRVTSFKLCFIDNNFDTTSVINIMFVIHYFSSKLFYAGLLEKTFNNVISLENDSMIPKITTRSPQKVSYHYYF